MLDYLKIKKKIKTVWGWEVQKQKIKITMIYIFSKNLLI